MVFGRFDTNRSRFDTYVKSIQYKLKVVFVGPRSKIKLEEIPKRRSFSLLTHPTAMERILLPMASLYRNDFVSKRP